MRRTTLLFTITMGLLLQALNSQADVLYLTNGDKLTGTIVNMEDSKLIFWTKYAGEITLFWQDVDHFEMDDPSKIVLINQPPTTDTAAQQGAEVTTEDIEPEPESTPPQPSPETILAINPKPVVPVKINTSVKTKLTGERGNTDKDVYYIEADFSARTASRRYAFDGEYEKEKKNNYLTEENWILHGKINQFVDAERYMYIDSLFENDKFKDLDLRSTYGAGVGYQFVEKEQVNLSISTGLAWVTEDFYAAKSKEFIASQWAIDFDRYLYRNMVQFFHSDKGYISLENNGDWFIKTKTGFRFPLYRGFTATIQYEYDWDNEPASDSETEEDSKFLFLLGYQFKN